MAKAKLGMPFSELSGRLDHESEVYYCTRLGETVVSHYPKRRDPKKITAHQRDLNAGFSLAVRRASEELADPARHAYWQSLFSAQPAPQRYKTLRGFIIAQLSKNQ